VESANQRYDRYKEEKKRLTEAARNRSYAAQAAASSSRASDNEKIGRNARREKAAGSHARAAASLSTRLEQLQEPEKPKVELNLNFRFDTTSTKLSPVALEMRGGVVSFGEHKLGPYNLSVNSGDKVIILGPNGSGKSVLLKAIAGILKLSTGSVSVGGGVQIGYVDQDYSFPSANEPIASQLRSMTGTDRSEVLRILARFGIPRDKANSRPSELSPGQRARVKLGSLVSQGANLLLLDEPTNHLDIPASDELQAALREFRGTLLVVTHDRELISNLPNCKLVVVKDGEIAPEKERIKYIKLLVD
jgi:ATPase subunit of ABC transporter with duplicated ATPase domains